ncbi:MAG: metallophosphoesterase [Atopostipes suicloacalis]|nr:metallophosphoesterase [Atopostipes suicloacalis]MDN6730595.1 metallophosphoesterase [Atopostipes suicloacalis]
MKVSFISDLHVDLNSKIPPKTYLYELLKAIEREETDLLTIGGDLTNNYQSTMNFVEKLEKQAGIPVYFIPGNHDFWEETKNKNTWKIYDLFKDHPQSLIESPLKLTEDYSLVAHPAWYNHAVYDKKQFSKAEVEEGKFRWSYWQDKLNMDWEATDQEVSRHFANLIEKDLKNVQTKKVILQTHVITIPEFTVPMPHKVFDFFNAYIATDDLKEIQKNYPVSHHFMGHIHFRAKIEKNESQFITNSLGYRREWRTKNLKEEIADSLVSIEI